MTSLCLRIIVAAAVVMLVSSQPVSAEEPLSMPAPVPDASVGQAVRAFEKKLGKTMAINSVAKRTQLQRVLLNKIEEALSQSADGPSGEIALLGARAKALLALHDAGIEAAVRLQHTRYQATYSDLQYARWTTEEIDRLRQDEHFKALAVTHLRIVTRGQPDSQLSVRRRIMIGDILIQLNYPDGPYDEAIVQFANVANAYSETFPDLALDAQLRQARALWLNDQHDEAQALLATLMQSDSELVADLASHTKQALEGLKP